MKSTNYNGLSEITVEQEPVFKGSNTCNMYAVRKIS
jgi:hypothetical protein